MKSSDGWVVFDKSGKMNGRGAYVMKDEKCLLSPKLRDKLQAALKTNINNEDFEVLLDDIKKESD